MASVCRIYKVRSLRKILSPSETSGPANLGTDGVQQREEDPDVFFSDRNTMLFTLGVNRDPFQGPAVGQQ